MSEPMEDEKQENVTQPTVEIPDWESTGSGYEEVHEPDPEELAAEQAAEEAAEKKYKRIEKIKDDIWFVLFILLIIFAIYCKFTE